MTEQELIAYLIKGDEMPLSYWLTPIKIWCIIRYWVLYRTLTMLILSHSVTPLRDSVPALWKYAAERHIDNKNWLLLTGDKDATYRLARQAYFADEESGFAKKPDEFLHTENVVLIDTKGRIRGVYNASLAVEIDMLVEDITQLQKEI